MTETKTDLDAVIKFTVLYLTTGAVFVFSRVVTRDEQGDGVGLRPFYVGDIDDVNESQLDALKEEAIDRGRIATALNKQEGMGITPHKDRWRTGP